jgi:hypothetical protein
MKPRPHDTPPPAGHGAIRSDELMTLREFGARLGFGRRILTDFQKQGLRTITAGRLKLVLARDAIQFFDGLDDARRDGGPTA